MLELKNVTIKHKHKLLLHNCSCNIPSQSIILARNNVNTNIVARTLAGFRSVDEGEIHLKKTCLIKSNTTNKSINKIFFMITDNYNNFWKNYRLLDISKILTKKYKKSVLCEKYKISIHNSIDSLTNFQKLIYFVTIGLSLERIIFIFDQPTKYFDYKELDNFYHFLKNDFSENNYIIFTNRMEDTFINLESLIYEIDTNKKKLLLKGGERNADGQEK